MSQISLILSNVPEKLGLSSQKSPPSLVGMYAEIAAHSHSHGGVRLCEIVYGIVLCDGDADDCIVCGVIVTLSVRS